MLRMKALIFLFVRAVLFLLPTGVVWADIRVPKLVGNDMVLQRDAKVELWGWADPGEKIRIAFHGQQVTTRADRRGEWSTYLGPFSAGGPYEMTLQGKNSIRLRNILLGDVWLASGQSNMEFPIEPGPEWRTGVNNADLEVARANYPQVRLMIVRHNASINPVADVDTDGWRVVAPDTVGDFSAIAYLFGKELHERYHIPIGLIESSWGGTVAEAWMSRTALHAFAEFQPVINSMARVDRNAEAAYRQFQEQRETWHQEHGATDLGRVDGHDVWADPHLDVSAWPTIIEPRPFKEWGKDFDEFTGIVWFRRSITLSPEQAGKQALLHMGYEVKDDTTYFNGEKIGATQGAKPRDYVVPGRLVRSGENVIAVRIAGKHDPDPSESAIGIFGPEEKMYAEVGATTMSLAGTWSYHPGTDLESFPKASPEILAARPDPNAPTNLFNGMIDPLVRFQIKGVIWYQGESNAIDNRSFQYRSLFPALIQDWRQHWRSQVPFLFVQLAGYGPEQPESAECPWAELREAQAMALALPSTGMATAVDIGDAIDIHPKNKQDVAHRLVLAAARVVYREDIIDTGPTYQSVLVEGSRIRVKFSNLGGGLRINDRYGYARGFEVAGEDHKFAWAQARQDGHDIIVYNDAIPKPVAVRYDWSNTPDGNVFSTEGLPALPFRAEADQSLAER